MCDGENIAYFRVYIASQATEIAHQSCVQEEFIVTTVNFFLHRREFRSVQVALQSIYV